MISENCFRSFSKSVVPSLPKVDVIVVAAGSEDERRRFGRLGLKHRKALVDVGADYFRGHVQVRSALHVACWIRAGLCFRNRNG